MIDSKAVVLTTNVAVESSNKLSVVFHVTQCFYIILCGCLIPSYLYFHASASTTELLQNYYKSFHAGPIIELLRPNIDYEFGKTVAILDGIFAVIYLILALLFIRQYYRFCFMNQNKLEAFLKREVARKRYSAPGKSANATLLQKAWYYYYCWTDPFSRLHAVKTFIFNCIGITFETYQLVTFANSGFPSAYLMIFSTFILLNGTSFSLFFLLKGTEQMPKLLCFDTVFDLCYVTIFPILTLYGTMPTFVSESTFIKHEVIVNGLACNNPLKLIAFIAPFAFTSMRLFKILKLNRQQLLTRVIECRKRTSSECKVRSTASITSVASFRNAFPIVKKNQVVVPRVYCFLCLACTWLIFLTSVYHLTLKHECSAEMNAICQTKVHPFTSASASDACPCLDATLNCGKQHQDANVTNLLQHVMEESPRSLRILSAIRCDGAEGRLKLSTLPSQSLGQLESLVFLVLSSCALRSIPESICNIKSLKFLDVVINDMEALPECMGDLQKLNILEASRNRLLRLPESLTTVPLNFLSLGGNPLESFPSEMSRLGQSLVVLDVQDTGIETVPDFLSELTELKVLTIGGNPVCDTWQESINPTDQVTELFSHPAFGCTLTCSPGCMIFMRGDGKCNFPCYTEACEYDSGDCDDAV